MYYKCELLVGGYAYAATDHIKNWDDITVSFKRGDYDGIVRTFTDKFEFVKGARQLLLNEYERNYLKSSASIVISTRNNSWTWTERFRCALNFSTLSDDGFTLSVNAVDDSVAALIKAKKGTEYEYVVSEICESDKLLYDGLDIQNKLDFVCGGEMKDENAPNTFFVRYELGSNGVSLPMYMNETEYKIKHSIIPYDIPREYNLWDIGNTPEGLQFLKAERDKKIRLKFSFLMYANMQINIKGTLHAQLRKIDGEGNGTIIWNIQTKYDRSSSDAFLAGVKMGASYDNEISMKAGDRLYIVIYNDNEYQVEVTSDLIIENFKCDVVWTDRIDAVNLDVIQPAILLNRLLKSMNGGQEGLTGVIVPSGEMRLDNALILAAESARKMPGAKIYSSFTKFCNWMSSVFGYVYDINGKVITFRPRRDYFGEEVVKVVENYNSYQMNVNSSLIYSQVNVGYEKQDYDSVNGKDEFRFTNIYNTGTTLTDGKLELISPYRADAYGIEFLSQKAGEDTTDNESDNGVFFVCARLVGNNYILDRSMAITGVISPDTMFNVMYAPTSMIEANKAFLGGFISELSYASSEGNTSVTIEKKAENRNISLEGGLFNVNEVEIETSDVELPDDMTGIIQFEHQGKIMQGYYKSSDFHYNKSKSAKITLIMKK